MSQKNKKNNLGANMKAHIRQEFTEVAKELAGSKGKNKKRRNKNRRNSALSPRLRMSSEFAHAIMRPFDPNSQGVRVPDMYSFPTETYHVHGTVTAKAIFNGTLGCVFFPNPDVSLLDTSADKEGVQCISGTSMTACCVQTERSSIYSAGEMSAFSSYRVASWGIRITNLQPVLNATGKLYIACMPSIPDTPNSDLIRDMGGDFLTAQGLWTPILTGSGDLNTAAILGLPVSRHIDVSELIPGAINVNGRCINPVFYNFKSCKFVNNAAGGISIGNSLVQNASGTIKGRVENNSISNMTGGMNIVIFGEGFPVGQDALDIEYIYHFEVTQQPNTNQVIPIASGAKVSYPGDSMMVEAAVNVSNKEQPVTFRTELEEMASSAFGAAEKVYGASQTPLGKMITGSLMALF